MIGFGIAVRRPSSALKRALMVYRLGYINLTVYLFLFPFMLEDTALVLGDQVQGAAYFELSLLDRTTQPCNSLCCSRYTSVLR